MRLVHNKGGKGIVVRNLREFVTNLCTFLLQLVSEKTNTKQFVYDWRLVGLGRIFGILIFRGLNSMVDIIGYIGAACLALCAAPQAIKSFKDKRTVGMSVWFILLWYVGEILTLIYIVSTTMQIPLVINYLFNIMCITGIIYYWRKDEKR